jgi:hypothetical protein
VRAVANVPAPGNPNAPDAIQEAEKETFATKVAKFIPGEVTAVYAALAVGAAAASKSLSETDPPTWPLWIAFVVGVAASPLYWYIERQSSERRKREAGEPIPVTRWYGYLFAAVAFVPWALAVSTDTRQLMAVPDELAEFFLVIGALVIPGLSNGFDIYYRNKEEREATNGKEKERA